MARLTGRNSLLVGALAAVGASTCCLGPLLLLSAGISGAWIGHLTAMEPYRPIFIVLTLLFLGLAFRRLYFAPKASAPGVACGTPRNARRQRLTFWIIAALSILLLASPYLIAVTD